MTSAVSRIGTASTRIGSSSVATVVSATFQLAASAERREREPEHLAARVAHEDGGRLAGRRLKGRKPTQASRDGERERRARRRSGASVTASIAKNAAGDRGERRREAVHVVEQVERVRHPDEPDDARSRSASDVVRDDLAPRSAGREHDRGRADLRAELRDRRQRVEVVGEPGDEEDRAAGEDPERARRRRRRTPAATASSDAGERCRRRCRCRRTTASTCSCQRSPRGAATSRRASGERSSAPDHERADGERDERDALTRRVPGRAGTRER